MTNNNYRSWFDKAYPFLSGHGLWLRGNELNTVPPAEWATRGFRILITRLSTCRDTADSFTHKLLYQIAARIEGVFPDLAWLPPPKDADVFDRDEVPWLLGATSKNGGRAFDVIALSNSIVQELVNVPVMLAKSGIAVDKQERMRDPSAPLVLLGGASALHASVLHGPDSPVDGIFVGEDATAIEKLFRTCRDHKTAGSSKAALLAALEEVPGFITPDGSGSTTVYHAPHLGREQLLEDGPVLMHDDTLGRGNLQISEGCTCFCSFCAEGYSRKPYREFSAAEVREQALRQKAFMGIDDMELYSFNFNMHRDFYPILRDLSALFPSLGLKSQRFDSIAQDPSLIANLHAVDKSSITCGLEGISHRLRCYLNKSIEEQDLKKSLFALLSSPLRELKIFLIATGLEETADFDEFRDLLRYIESVMHSAVRRPRIVFSMTILVRFPWTPLEFEDAAPENDCLDIIRRTERTVKGAGFEFRASAESADYWLSQVLVRASDPRIASALWRARKATEYVYYREVPASFVGRFRQELSTDGLTHDTLLKGHTPQERAAKPWARISTGVDERFLAGQWLKAKEFHDTGYCAGSLTHEGSCLGCGACRDDNTKETITGRHAIRRDYRSDELKALHQTGRTEQVALYFRVSAQEAARGVPRAALGIALARACMLTRSGLTEGYRGFGGSFIHHTYKSNWLSGDDIVTLLWGRRDQPVIEALFSDRASVDKVNRLMAGFGTVSGLLPSRTATVSALSFSSPFPFDPTPYCKDRALKYTERKTPGGIRQFDLSKESLKKKIFSAMTSSPGATDDGTIVSIEKPGQRFDPEEFARRAFRVLTEEEWVRIGITANLDF